MTTKQFDNYADLITFTRGSTGTYLDSDGLLKTATTNTPRIEYDADGNRLGLLIEEARTNLNVWSENFTQWIDANGNITQTASGDTSPDGGTNAYVVADTGDGDDFIYRNITVSADTTTYTYSLFVKKTAGDSHFMNIAIAFLGGTTAYGQATFNTNLGVFSATQGIVAGSAVVEDAGDWWRIAISSANNSTGTTLQFRFYPAFNSDGTITRNNATTGSKVVFGAQLEAGSFPTSYIPTSGSTATRSADVASIPTSAFGFNANVGAGGTVIADFQSDKWQLGTVFYRVWEFDGTSNIDGLFHAADNPNQFRYRLNDSSGNAVLGASTIGSVTATASAGAKIAISYERDDFAVYANGSQFELDTAGLFANELVTQIALGGGSIGTPANGHIKSIQYYPRRLTNSQLQRLTS